VIPGARTRRGGGGFVNENRGADSSTTTITEVVADEHPALTEAEARVLTDQIRAQGEEVADRVDLMVAKVREARDGQAHIALGYASWTIYISTEFAGILPRLDREPRRELVAGLTETGMSTRAIAPIVGVSHEQVRQDARVKSLTPDDHTDLAASPMATASDGEFEQAIVEARTDGNLSQTNVEQKITTRNVIGVDGKQYPRTEPSEPRRNPLPARYERAVLDLEKSVRRLQRLHADDRFLASRERLVEKVGPGRRVGDLAELVSEIEDDLHGRHRCYDCEERLPIRGDYHTKCAACEAES